MSARTRQDWILWGALGCALVGTAHSEWSLAVSIGAHPWIAAAVPGALDLYVIRALQQRRDVFVAVLAMVAANVAWYLVHSGDLPIGWQLRSAVGAVAPLVVWRVHSLKYTRTRQELLWGQEAGAGSAPAPVVEYTAPAPAPVWTPGFHLDGCDGVHALEGPVNCATRASALECSAPQYIPAAWMDDEYPETHPSAPALETSAPLRLHSVPDLPPEYVAGAVHSESPLTEKDLPFLAGAQEYADKCAQPSVRGLKAELKIGQDRAERLLTHLGVIL